MAINAPTLTEVTSKEYKAILETVLEESIQITERVEASFHFVKYHDCNDREEDFLKALRKYTVYYCFPKERYQHQDVTEITSLSYEARDKFFNPSNPKNSGELGELALYFLLESYLNAPQIVSKMSLKTSGHTNSNGSDGVHFGIHNGKKCIFYCESKLDKDRSDAFRLCKESVLDFHQNRKAFEISVIRNNIDVKDEVLKKEILYYLDPTTEKSDDWIEVNACFIGYNWSHFNEIEKESNNTILHEKLKSKLLVEIEEVKNYLKPRLRYPEIKQRFYFFVVPFKDVENLRSKFMELLYGSK